MSLIKVSSGSTPTAKRIYTAHVLASNLVQAISQNELAKVCGDSTIFDNVEVDTNYFTLDGATNFYYANKDFSFLLQWSSWAWVNVNLNDKLYMGAQEITTNDMIMQQICSVDNLMTGQSFHRYHYNLYPFQAFENHFIGFTQRLIGSKTLTLSNSAISQNDLGCNISIDLVSE